MCGWVGGPCHGCRVPQPHVMGCPGEPQGREGVRGEVDWGAGHDGRGDGGGGGVMDTPPLAPPQPPPRGIHQGVRGENDHAGGSPIGGWAPLHYHRHIVPRGHPLHPATAGSGGQGAPRYPLPAEGEGGWGGHPCPCRPWVHGDALAPPPSTPHTQVQGVGGGSESQGRGRGVRGEGATTTTTTAATSSSTATHCNCCRCCQGGATGEVGGWGVGRVRHGPRGGGKTTTNSPTLPTRSRLGNAAEPGGCGGTPSP